MSNNIIPVGNFVLLRKWRAKGVVQEHGTGEDAGVHHVRFFDKAQKCFRTILTSCEEFIDMGPDGVYTIQINEEQRAALLRLVENSGLDLTATDEPLEFWDNMLEDLPKLEKESPGLLHGFCL